MKLRFSIRDLLARIKRPQFSLRMLLLATALVASLVGLLAARERERLANLHGEQKRVQLEIDDWQKYLAELKAKLASSTSDQKREELLWAIKWVGEEIKERRTKIEMAGK